MATWPVTLPQSPLLAGYKEDPVDSRIRSSVDAGAQKVRNRYTANVINVTEQYWLTEAQYNTFIDFYEDTLGNGAESFSKPHPFRIGTKLYRFLSPYSQMNSSGNFYQVQLNLEILPQ